MIITKKLNKKSFLRIFKANKFYFAANLTTTTYPYIFGGLNIPFKQNPTASITIKELFGDDTFDGFKEAYKYTLTSLANKQKGNLQNVLQSNLTKNIMFKNVNLVNQDANIEVVCAGSLKAFGAGFNRAQSNLELKLMDNQDNNMFYLNIGLMNSSNPASMMKYMSSGLPVLLAFDVLFSTEMKLVPEGQTAKKQKQVHSVQFQVEGKVNVMKYMKTAMSFANNKQKNMDPTKARDILHDLIGENFQWKIGDIDRVLKGNIKVI